MLSGMSKTGKSCILKILLISASKSRQVILFSYGDEYNDVMHINVNSLYGDCMDVNRTIIIDKIKIRPSELDSAEYWKWLVPPSSAIYLAGVSKSRHLHHDIPEEFFNMVRNAKTQSFTQDDNIVHEASKVSILSRIDMLMDFLDSESVDWVGLLKSRRNIIINLNLSKEDELLAQFIVGFILRKIKPYIHLTNPVIAFEEADILVPYDYLSFSGKEIIDYNLKMKKAGVFMFYVVQESYRLPRTIADNTDKFIYGKQNMSGDGFLPTLVNSIRWIHHRDIREFVYYDRSYNFVTKFNPITVPCYTVER